MDAKLRSDLLALVRSMLEDVRALKESNRQVQKELESISIRIKQEKHN